MNCTEITRILHAEGKRITEERRVVLRIITDNPHLTAAEIYQLARKEATKLSLSTVYRTVKLLKELGLVQLSDLGKGHHHYELGLTEHYHFICLGCGKVVEIPSTSAFQELAEKRGFEVIGAEVQLVGYCTKCCKKRTRGAMARFVAPRYEKRKTHDSHRSGRATKLW